LLLLLPLVILNLSLFCGIVTGLETLRAEATKEKRTTEETEIRKQSK
jgi:hypothetical protein